MLPQRTEPALEPDMTQSEKQPRATLPANSSTAVSRRLFLKSSGAAVAAAGVTAPVAAQQATPPVATPAQGAAEAPNNLQFLNPTEAVMVDALVARIMPGTPDDPGAREADVLFYIDRTLAGTNEGYSKMTYTHGPFLNVTEEQADVEATSRTDIYQVVPVRQTDVSRYGYQSLLTPQDIYRRGLEALAAYAQSEYGGAFADLSESQQDEILTSMEADEATGFDAPSGSAFFTMLRNDTIEGMFCDPMYGGNRDMVGWKLIGYPGARGFYTSDEMQDPNFSAEPMSLADMPDMHSH
jgi:gluconate 2-dehydrogenase gamma chain